MSQNTNNTPKAGQVPTPGQVPALGQVPTLGQVPAFGQVAAAGGGVNKTTQDLCCLCKGNKYTYVIIPGCSCSCIKYSDDGETPGEYVLDSQVDDIITLKPKEE